MSSRLILCLTGAVLTSIIAAEPFATGNENITLIEHKGNWFEAKRHCQNHNSGELVSAKDVITCSRLPNGFPNQNTSLVWSGGYKVPAWVKTEGCYNVTNNITRFSNISLEQCISMCETRHVGFKGNAGQCMCCESISALSKSSASQCNQCTATTCGSITVYTVTNLSIDIDFSIRECVGLYLNCNKSNPVILPTNCDARHRSICENGDTMVAYNMYNQSQAESKCDINNGVLMTDLNKTCAAFNGSTAWTSLKLFWIDPVFSNQGTNDIRNINYCSYTFCATKSATGISTSGNCSLTLDGYACNSLPDKNETSREEISYKMTETVTSQYTNGITRPISATNKISLDYMTPSKHQSSSEHTSSYHNTTSTDTLGLIQTTYISTKISSKKVETCNVTTSKKQTSTGNILFNHDTTSTDTSGHIQTTYLSTETPLNKVENSNGTTIGIIVAVVVVASLTTVIVVLLLLRRSRRKSPNQGNSTVSKNKSQHGSSENYESPWDSEGSKTNSLIFQGVLSMSVNGSASMPMRKPDVDLTTYAVVNKAAKTETAFHVQVPSAQSDSTIKNETEIDPPEDDYDRLHRISNPAKIKTLSENVYDSASGSRDTEDVTYNSMDHDGSWKEGKASNTLDHYS